MSRATPVPTCGTLAASHSIAGLLAQGDAPLGPQPGGPSASVQVILRALASEYPGMSLAWGAHDIIARALAQHRPIPINQIAIDAGSLALGDPLYAHPVEVIAAPTLASFYLTPASGLALAMRSRSSVPLRVAQEFRKRWVRNDHTKYWRPHGTRPLHPYVVIVGQTAADNSLAGARLTKGWETRLLEQAKRDHPNCRIYFAPHPRGGSLTLPGATTWNFGHPATYLADHRCEQVYVGASTVGWEAILHGRRPVIEGQPFYKARNTTPIDCLVARYLAAVHYVDPLTGARLDPLSALKLVEEDRHHRNRQRHKTGFLWTADHRRWDALHLSVESFALHYPDVPRFIVSDQPASHLGNWIPMRVFSGSRSLQTGRWPASFLWWLTHLEALPCRNVISLDSDIIARERVPLPVINNSHPLMADAVRPGWFNTGVVAVHLPWWRRMKFGPLVHKLQFDRIENYRTFRDQGVFNDLWGQICEPLPAGLVQRVRLPLAEPVVSRAWLHCLGAGGTPELLKQVM